MRTIFRFAGMFIGVLLDALAFLGVQYDPEKWVKFLEPYADFIPLASALFYLIGTSLIVYVSADLWTARRLKHMGGRSGKEFPADLERWGGVNNFTVWQLSWLWNNLEPQQARAPTEGTPAYPTYRRFKEHLSEGKIKDAQKKDGSWLWTTLDRQTLIDYALLIGEAPIFLFPKRRQWRFLKWLKLIETIPIDRARNYQGVSSTIAHYLASIPDNEIGDVAVAYEDTQAEMVECFRNGRFTAIGRRKLGNLYYDYETIAPLRWRRLSLTGFDGATNQKGETIFGDIKVDFRTWPKASTCP